MAASEELLDENGTEVTGATGHEDVLGPDRLRLGRRLPHMQDDIGVGRPYERRPRIVEGAYEQAADVVSGQSSG